MGDGKPLPADLTVSTPHTCHVSSLTGETDSLLGSRANPLPSARGIVRTYLVLAISLSLRAKPSQKKLLSLLSPGYELPRFCSDRRILTNLMQSWDHNADFRCHGFNVLGPTNNLMGPLVQFNRHTTGAQAVCASSMELERGKNGDDCLPYVIRHSLSLCLSFPGGRNTTATLGYLVARVLLISTFPASTTHQVWGEKRVARAPHAILWPALRAALQHLDFMAISL